MARTGFRAIALRALLGVLAGALVGTGAVWAVFKTGSPLLDRIFLSNPYNICGYDHPPLCMAREYGLTGVRIALALAVAGLPIWAVLRARRRESRLNLALAWAAAGFLIELAYEFSKFRTFSVPPLWALSFLAGPALLAALIAAVMAVVFRLIVGERPEAASLR
jgi:hypothetical protein